MNHFEEESLQDLHVNINLPDQNFNFYAKADPLEKAFILKREFKNRNEVLNELSLPKAK